MVETTAGRDSELLRGLNGAHCDCGHRSPGLRQRVGFVLGEGFWALGGVASIVCQVGAER
jgi:hypothetical protein